VPRSRIVGDIPPLPPAPAWFVVGLLIIIKVNATVILCKEVNGFESRHVDVQCTFCEDRDEAKEIIS
jgi:hypothetical protein